MCLWRQSPAARRQGLWILNEKRTCALQRHVIAYYRIKMIASWKVTQILWKRRLLLYYLKSNSSSQVHGLGVGLYSYWFSLRDDDYIIIIIIIIVSWV
jgi:hypothetical protein